MKLSIVIVNWNSKDQTKDCLESLRKHCAELDLQIIVVDGGSFDGCDKMISECYSEVTFIQSPDNVGFGRSNNLGAAKAEGEVLLLLNPDTEVEPGSIQYLLQQLQTLPSPGIIGPHLLNTDGTRQEGSVHSFPTPVNQALDSEFLRRAFPKSRMWNSYNAFNRSSPSPVDAVGGACMIMWRSTFEKVGGFTPNYFMYAEDMDLCLKVHRLGLINYHAPEAKIFHHAGCSSEKQFSEFSSVLMPNSLYLYMQLNHGAFTAFRYRFLLFLSAFLRTTLLSISYPITKPAAKNRRIQSLKRWFAVTIWSLGGKRWSREYRKA